MDQSTRESGSAGDPAPASLADRLDRLEARQASLLRRLTERGILPHAVEEPAPASPRLTVAGDGATLACAAAVVGAILSAALGS